MCILLRVVFVCLITRVPFPSAAAWCLQLLQHLLADGSLIARGIHPHPRLSGVTLRRSLWMQDSG